MNAYLKYPFKNHSGNIIWAKPYIYPRFELSEAIEKLTNQKYWVSEFPEGDGLTFTHESKSNKDITIDFEIAFPWIDFIPKSEKEKCNHDVELFKDQIIILPIARILLHEPIHTNSISIYPAGYWDFTQLNVSSLNEEFFKDSENESLRDHVTEITKFDFSRIQHLALIVLRIKMNPSKYFDINQQEDCSLIKECSEKCEDLLDIIRFQECRYTVQEFLPSKAGIWNDRYSVAIYHFPKYQKAFFQSREVELKNYIKGIGLEIRNADTIQYHRLLLDDINETGVISKVALKMNTQILESENETMKFINIFRLIEYCSSPFKYEKFQNLKKSYLSCIAKNKTEYHALSIRYKELTAGINHKPGLRTSIIHVGKNLFELIPNSKDRRELFLELESHVMQKLYNMIHFYNVSWSEYSIEIEKKYNKLMNE